MQKKSLVLQFSLQNGVIVQQHQHLLTMESTYFLLFFIISKTLITAYLPPSAYVYNAINFRSPYAICISNSAGVWQWALLILWRNCNGICSKENGDREVYGCSCQVLKCPLSPPALTCLCFIEQHNSRLETQYNYLKVIDGSHEEQEEEFGLNLIPYFPNPAVFVCFFFPSLGCRTI